MKKVLMGLCVVLACATICARGDVPRAQLVPDGLTVRELEVGANLFRDRSFTLKELPDALKGCLFVAGPFDGAPSVRAEVARDGVLTVISPASGRVSQAETLKAQGFALDASVPVFQAWGGAMRATAQTRRNAPARAGISRCWRRKSF